MEENHFNDSKRQERSSSTASNFHCHSVNMITDIKVSVYSPQAVDTTRSIRREPLQPAGITVLLSDTAKRTIQVLIYKT